MNKKKRKRKEIVNYCVKGYAHSSYVGNLIIGRDHPLFDKEDARDTLIKQWGDYTLCIAYGHEKGGRMICKKKFRNLNFRVIQFYSYDSEEKLFTDLTMSRRGDLIMEWIKQKREENKE